MTTTYLNKYRIAIETTKIYKFKSYLTKILIIILTNVTFFKKNKTLNYKLLTNIEYIYILELYFLI